MENWINLLRLVEKRIKIRIREIYRIKQFYIYRIMEK